MDKTSMTLGWLVGRQIAGQRTKQKTLIGYSYNGTVLPALPEWDKETYPYAVIYSDFLILSASPFRIKESGYFDDTLINWMRYEIDESGEWVLRDSRENSHYGAWVYPGVTWSNHDVLNEDGTLHLAATAPIPVYDLPT